jgi:hypothetical protein
MCPRVHLPEFCYSRGTPPTALASKSAQKVFSLTTAAAVHQPSAKRTASLLTAVIYAQFLIEMIIFIDSSII